MIFLDTGNLYYCARKRFGQEYKINYELLVEYIENIFGEQQCYAYVQEIGVYQKFVSMLKHTINAKVRTKDTASHVITCSQCGQVRTYKEMFTVEIAIDVMRTLSQDNPIILCTSDIGILPILRVLKSNNFVTCVCAIGVPHAFYEYATVREIEQNILIQG